MSTNLSTVKAVSFFQGTLKVSNTTDHSTRSFHFYAGLNQMVVEECNLQTTCPPHGQHWDSDSCRQYFTNCDDCSVAAVGTIMPLMMAFVTMVPQIVTDLSRSRAENDLHCQKT
jgi:hypothetical protein